MEVLFLKLKNGIDLIANTTFNNDIATLYNPVSLRPYQDRSGGIGLTFMEWIPSSVVSEISFKLAMSEILIISKLSSDMKDYYTSWISQKTNQEEEVSDEAESYQKILTALTSNKRLLH